MTENKGLVESIATLKKKKGLSKLLITAGSIDRTDSAVYHFNNRDRDHLHLDRTFRWQSSTLFYDFPPRRSPHPSV